MGEAVQAGREPEPTVRAARRPPPLPTTRSGRRRAPERWQSPRGGGRRGSVRNACRPCRSRRAPRYGPKRPSASEPVSAAAVPQPPRSRVRVSRSGTAWPLGRRPGGGGACSQSRSGARPAAAGAAAAWVSRGRPPSGARSPAASTTAARAAGRKGARGPARASGCEAPASGCEAERAPAREGAWAQVPSAAATPDPVWAVAPGPVWAVARVAESRPSSRGRWPSRAGAPSQSAAVEDRPRAPVSKRSRRRRSTRAQARPATASEADEVAAGAASSRYFPATKENVLGPSTGPYLFAERGPIPGKTYQR